MRAMLGAFHFIAAPKLCPDLDCFKFSLRLTLIRLAGTANILVAMALVTHGDVSWERMIGAVEKVRQRVRRASSALEAAGIPYAVVGGNAVAAWVSRVDEAAVRNTQDVDILLRRSDLDAAEAALGQAGFVRRHVKGIEMFLDGPNAKARDAVHIILANEKVAPSSPEPAPDITQAELSGNLRVISLPGLVRMKLSSFRDKDRVHLRDLIEVGLIDESWCERFPPELAHRLQSIFANPNG